MFILKKWECWLINWGILDPPILAMIQLILMITGMQYPESLVTGWSSMVLKQFSDCKPLWQIKHIRLLPRIFKTSLFPLIGPTTSPTIRPANPQRPCAGIFSGTQHPLRSRPLGKWRRWSPLTCSPGHGHRLETWRNYPRWVLMW